MSRRYECSRACIGTLPNVESDCAWSKPTPRCATCSGPKDWRSRSATSVGTCPWTRPSRNFKKKARLPRQPNQSHQPAWPEAEASRTCRGSDDSHQENRRIDCPSLTEERFHEKEGVSA